jgi:hypothetical protein
MVTLTQRNLDEFRAFFSENNGSIIRGILDGKDTQFVMSKETQREFYESCLDGDPANGEYLYHVIRLRYAQKEFKE